MKEPKVNIEIPKMSENRKDSFWYKDDGQVATVTHKGRILSIEPRGEIRIMFKVDGEVFRNKQAVDEATRRRIGDKQLEKINLFDGWINNNWFVIIELDDKGNDVDDDLYIGYDYDDMIETAIEMAKKF